MDVLPGGYFFLGGVDLEKKCSRGRQQWRQSMFVSKEGGKIFAMIQEGKEYVSTT